MESHAIQPNLRIFQRIEHIAPGERFVLCGIAICFQPGVEECALIIRDEAGFGRPVGDIPVSRYGQNAGEDAFKNEYLQTVSNRRAYSIDMEAVLTHRQPLSPPTPFI